MKSSYLAGVIPVVLSACSTTTTTLPDVSSLTFVTQPISVPKLQTHHHSVIRDFERREPTEPKPWRKLNDEQSTENGALG